MKKLNKYLALTTTALALVASSAVLAQDKTTLSWALWDLSSAPTWQALIDAYEAKNPNIDIEPVDLGSADYNQMVQTQLTGGADNLDIITIKDVPGYVSMIRTGALADITSMLGADGVDPKGYNGLVEALTVDGKVYGLPFRSDFWVLYYNKDVFDAAGVPYPSNDMTIAQFDETARKLTSGMGADKTYGGLFHTWRSTVQLPGILDGQNTLVDGQYDFLKPYYDRVLALQSEGVVPSYSHLKSTSSHYSGQFFSGKIAMMPMGSWFITTQIAKVDSGESLSKNWGIAKFPHPDGVAAGTTVATVTAVSVNSKSKKAEAAADFVKWVAGPEGAAVVAGTNTIPALLTDEVIAAITSAPGFPADEASREAMKVTQSYLEIPAHPNVSAIELVLNRAHDNIMTDNISVEDGLKEMSDGVAAIQ
jgi:multiple sugar transport system substrate-binding protein